LYKPKKTLLIYRNKLDKHRFGSIKGKPSERLYKIADELMWDDTFNGLRDKLKGYDAIFVAGVNSRCRNGILKYCKEEGITGFFLPHVGDLIMQESMHIQSFDSPVLFVTRSVIRPEYRIVKRIFDFCMSLLGIIVLSPVMAVTAVAIKAYDGGPALYKQVRLTTDGKEFKIWKFRSMRVDAEKDGVARLSTGDKDDRITPIGKIVRKCRLDELPQLFNILKGDMSIVGPRPERPEIAEQYYESIPDFKLRLQVKAGLTGYAQVYGKYNTDPYEKLEFGLLYINNMCVLTDLKLIFATVMVLFSSESTTGVEGVTAMDYEEED
jgi:exopolysaccharide biosynthesis polyprenyl glycosylphosphotransferase